MEVLCQLIYSWNQISQIHHFYKQFQLVFSSFIVLDNQYNIHSRIHPFRCKSDNYINVTKREKILKQYLKIKNYYFYLCY